MGWDVDGTFTPARAAQPQVESLGMWKSVSRPCAIDAQGCITSHNFPRSQRIAGWFLREKHL